MTVWRAVWFALAALLLATAAPWLRAQDMQPVPALTDRVIDQTATLDPAQVQALSDKLAALEQSTGTQLVVLMVPTTAPEDIAAYAQRVADTWKIGRREVGDGLLILVAKGDRRMRIEVAKTLEGAIPDLAARLVIDNAMRPAFRNEDYAGGLNLAVDQLAARIRGEGLPLPEASGRSAPGAQLEDLGPFLFFGVLLAGSMFTRMFGRKLGTLLTSLGAGGITWWLTASLLLAGGATLIALIVVGLVGVGSLFNAVGRGHGGMGTGGWSGGGGWGGGGGGGGFSSGGGGDFGGGGASGDW
jgi:uncharacterized protein